MTNNAGFTLAPNQIIIWTKQHALAKGHPFAWMPFLRLYASSKIVRGGAQWSQNVNRNGGTNVTHQQ